MVEVCLPWLDLDCSGEAFDCLLIVSPSVERYAFVIVSVGILGIDLNRSGVISDSRVKFTKFVVGKPAIEKCLEVVRVDL